MKATKRVAVVLLLLLAMPAATFAQQLGTIAGAVKDTSGAVLPGVTVEVASPALIERVRTTVADGSGLYTVINLPVGTYTVTFTLTGFNTVKREGVQLPANFTATINAEMNVGALEETITVTGESPTVDLRSAGIARSVTPEVIRAIPNGGTMYQLAQMTVGVNMTSTQDVGGTAGSPKGNQLVSHGGRPGDELQLVDGLRAGNSTSQAGRSGLIFSPLLFDQVDIQVSGQSGEAATNGVVSNGVPRSGGNTFSGTIYVNGSGPELQSDNLSDRLVAMGLRSASRIKALYDANAAIGGPVKRDRVWFFSTVRKQRNDNYSAGGYYPIDPAAWIREDDLGKRSNDNQPTWDVTTRGTATITSKMRVAGFIDRQTRVFQHWNGVTSATSPEAYTYTPFPQWMATATWNYTPTNRLLFEAGHSHIHNGWRQYPIEGYMPGEKMGPVRIVEQGGVLFQGRNLAPISYGRAGAVSSPYNSTIQAERAVISYVTGSHSAKVGMDMQHFFIVNDAVNFSNDIQYRTQGFVINQLTMFTPAGEYQVNLDYDLGIFAQDQWTMNRLTLQGALRLNMTKQSYEDYTLLPTRFTPNRPVTVLSGNDNVVNWKDLNPRLGASYDLFGTGKTALKFSATRGVAQDGAQTATSLAPANFIATSITRTVTGATLDTRTPSCDLLNPAANGQCGPWSSTLFGNFVTPNSTRDPGTLTGWHVRPYNWEFVASAQHELMPRVSMDVGYYRRIYGNFTVIDNPETVAADYTQYAVTVPTDSRLPTSGQQLTSVEVNPVLRNGNAFNTVTNYVTFTDNFARRTEHFNGVDVALNWRGAGSFTTSGGVAIGRTSQDTCDLQAALPEIATVPVGGGVTPLELCNTAANWAPNYKMIAVYEIPWQAIRVSSSFLSLPGPSVLANVIYSVADVTAALGRAPSGGGSRAINVIDTGTRLGDRRNQLDLRFSRIFRFGGATLDANFDVYNVTNTDAVLGQSATYGTTWLQPTTVLQPRIFKFGVRYDF
jgi:hypothetical protein